MSMSKKQGRVGSPGMVGIFPRMGNRNPAPTLARISSTEITKSDKLTTQKLKLDSVVC